MGRDALTATEARRWASEVLRAYHATDPSNAHEAIAVVLMMLDDQRPRTSTARERWNSHAFCAAKGVCLAKPEDPQSMHGEMCQDMTAALGSSQQNQGAVANPPKGTNHGT